MDLWDCSLLIPSLPSLQSDLFRKHEGLKNRRLLWHGTNVAVVAAILKTGLRIMPHSGGRVGRGIYFASECSKSAGYGEFTSVHVDPGRARVHSTHCSEMHQQHWYNVPERSSLGGGASHHDGRLYHYHSTQGVPQCDSQRKD